MQSLFVLFCLFITTLHASSGNQVNHKQRFSLNVSSKNNGWSLQMHACSTSECSTTMEHDDNSLSSSPKKQGLVMNIFNQNNGRNIFRKTFLLGEYWAHWLDLEWHVKRTVPGRIVVMAIAVTGTVGLRNASLILNHLGSLFAPHLSSSSHWTWVFIKGGRTVMESVVIGGRPDIYAHMEYYLNPKSTTSSSILELQRWKFCEDHGAMGGLCDASKPDELPIPNPEKLIFYPHSLDNIPIIVTAGKRLQYLYHSLTSLLKAPGIIKENILLVLGDTLPATLQLMQLLDLKYTKLHMLADSVNISTYGVENTKLFNYYKHVYELVLNKFPHAPAAIFLDEDVELSPDFFSYMSQTLWLLQTDKSLYCINGFSQLGLHGLAFDQARICRGQVQIEWGYAVSLKFIKEALELWKDNNNPKDTSLYDFWLYRHASNRRECIFPEVSRARHYGVGVNTIASMVENVFLRMKLQPETQILLKNASRLQLSYWRTDLIKGIKKSTTLRGNPCSPDFLPKSVQQNLNNKQYKFFYRLDSLPDGSPDFAQYFQTIGCFGTWSQSEQGHHDGVTIISPRVNMLLYIIGVPFSSYSYLRPKGVRLWDTDVLDNKVLEFNAKRMAIVNHANREWPNMTSTEDMIKILTS